MKKSLCIVLSVATLLLTFAACSKKAKEAPTTTTTEAPFEYSIVVDKTQVVTDAEGNTHVETVTDANGNAVTEVVQQTLPSVQNPEPLENGTKVENTSLVDEIVKPIFEGQKYTMVCATVAEGKTVPMTIVVDGNNLAIYTSLKEVLAASGNDSDQDISAFMGDEIRIVIKDGKSYTLMELLKQKVYMEEDTLGIETDSLTKPTSEEMTYVQTTSVKNGNKTYTCEEYKTADGTVKKFYFENRKLVRMETTSEGVTSVIEISALYTTVDQKFFSISGYKKFDESMLGSLAGGN